MKQRVRFVPSPPPLHGPQDPRAVWMDRLQLLVERPGEWAEVYSGTPSACNQAAGALRLRQYYVPPGGWEFTVRSFRRGHLSFGRDNHARAILFARYLGPDAEAFTPWSYQTSISDQAIWDQHGRRICPVCERNPLPHRGGSYPHSCDHCAASFAAHGVEHGTEKAYRHGGCRCPECREAARDAHRSRTLERLTNGEVA